MNVRSLATAVAAAVLLYVGWRSAGWGGVAFAGGGIVMVLLLQFHRMMHVMRKAAKRPKGRVGSAVMLNAKLKPGVNLLHVMAMTHSLGEPLSPPGAQPEIFRWTDDSGSSVECEFSAGRLLKWSLARPGATEPPAEAPAP